ncbi:MAG: GHKL domain-containing protein, partial [Streptococcus sp.]
MSLVEIAEPIGTPQIDLVDFITILSVFLDNAIEAAVNAEAPRISFTYFQENKNKILVIYNTTADYKIPYLKIFSNMESQPKGRCCLSRVCSNLLTLAIRN